MILYFQILKQCNSSLSDKRKNPNSSLNKQDIQDFLHNLEFQPDQYLRHYPFFRKQHKSSLFLQYISKEVYTDLCSNM